MNILDEIQNEHGADLQQQLASKLGIDPAQAASILPKVGPLILGALKKRMDTHGEDHVQGQVDEIGAADLSDIGAVLNNGAQNNDPDLGGLMGGKGEQASQMMANHLGISAGTALKIIPMLAPVILGMLRKRAAAAPGTDPNAGSGSSGGGLGGLGSILDRNGDGHILDDIGGMLTGGSAAGGAGRAGCLSSLLGGLLKGRR